MKTTRSKLVTSLVVVLAVICMTAFTACTKPTLYSEGSRVGTVFKLSKKGEVANQKTWEGELLVNAATNEVWRFSIDPADKEVAEQVHQAQLSGKRVELRYEQWKNDDSRGTYETEYRIKGVSPAS